MRHLRRLDVDLPIEVFHYPGELTDHGQRRDIENLGGTIREIRGVEKEEGAWKVSRPETVHVRLDGLGLRF